MLHYQSLMSHVSLWPFSAQCVVQIDQLLLVAIFIESFFRFQHCIMHDSFPIPPSAKHYFFSEAILKCYAC